MSLNNTRKWIINSFALSILLHLLILLSFSLILLRPPEENKKPPHHYVPAYTYTAPMRFSQAEKSHPANQAEKMKQPLEMPLQETKAPMKTDPVKRPPSSSLMASSLNWLQQNQNNMISKRREVEPILMVGDKNEVADPLVQALGKALSAHFRYPEEEGRWGIKGRVIVEMTLHPDGTFTDVNIVESSNNHNLDMAALYAVNSAPLVQGASKYLQASKHFVVGFGFY